MSKVLVTGGLGFLGSQVVRQCLEKGHTVRVLDNGFRGRQDRLGPHASQVEIFEGDVRDPMLARRACRGMDWVFHLAAVNGTRYFYEIPQEVLSVNVLGIITILQAAQAEGCSQFLFSSTSELYQMPEHIPTPETERIMIPDIRNPRFSYAGSKIIGELFCLNQSPSSLIKTVIVRYHNAYVPDMGQEHVIPEIFNKLRQASQDFKFSHCAIDIQGTGAETRAFNFVEDAASGTMTAMEKGEDREIYHIGTQEETSIRDLILLMGKILDLQIEIRPGPGREGSTPRRLPDITKLSRLGYKPQVLLEDGLRRTLEWYRAQAKPAKSAVV